jgi:hypothetical protein
MPKKDKGQQKKLDITNAIQLLASLKEVTVSSMTKKQVDDYLTVIGILLGIVDRSGKVK